jgi:hypothetical protein
MKLKMLENDGKIKMSALGSFGSGTIVEIENGWRVVGKMKDADHPFFIRNLHMTKRMALRTLKSAFFERAAIKKNTK